MRQMVRHEMKSLPQRPPKNPLGHTAHLAEPQEEDFLPSRMRPPLSAKMGSAQLGVERICHMVDIAATQPSVIQTETDRMLGELVRIVYVCFLTVLDAVEPFLLGGGDERAVDDQRGGGLVIHRVDSENVHRPTTRDMRLPCFRSKDTTEQQIVAMRDFEPACDPWAHYERIARVPSDQFGPHGACGQ